MLTNDTTNKLSLKYSLTRSDIYIANSLFMERKNWKQARKVISTFLLGMATCYAAYYIFFTVVYLISIMHGLVYPLIFTDPIIKGQLIISGRGFGDPAVLAQVTSPVSMLFWFFVIAFGLALWFDWSGHISAWLHFRANAKSYTESALLTLDESGLTFMLKSITSKIEWEFYNGVMENSYLFILLDRNGWYSIVPKRAFASEEEINVFRELIARKIPKSNS